jgi:hypothetical protein
MAGMDNGYVMVKGRKEIPIEDLIKKEILKHTSGLHARDSELY